MPFRFRPQWVASLGVALTTAVLVLGTPTSARGCPKGIACPAEFYPYSSLVDDTIYCSADNLQHLGGRNWVFHCCSGNVSRNVDLYITMPDDSTPSDASPWEGGELA